MMMLKMILLKLRKSISSSLGLAKPDFTIDAIIYTNVTEEFISTILFQKNENGLEQPITFTSQAFLIQQKKFMLIDKHASSFLKAIENSRNLILGKHLEVKVPLLVVKFFVSNILFRKVGTLTYKNIRA